MKASLDNIGIEDIEIVMAAEKCVPSQFGFALNEDYFESVTGARSLSHTGQNENAFSLCASAAEKLFARHPHLPSQLEAIFVVTLPTEPTVAPISARLQGRLGLKTDVFCLDLTLSCVGFLQAASLVTDLMRQRGWEKALVLNVETLTKIIRPDDHGLKLLMSDGAAATLFSRRGKFIFDRFRFFADGKLDGMLTARDGAMFMDGPQLYETVLRKVPVSFRETLEAFGSSRDEVDVFLFHQGSKKVLDKLTSVLELDSRKVPRTIEFGNLGSCAIPQLLQGLLHEPANRVRIFATAFGAGFQWAHSMIHQER